jgi:hypothetical protein
LRVHSVLIRFVLAAGGSHPAESEGSGSALAKMPGLALALLATTFASASVGDLLEGSLLVMVPLPANTAYFP